MKMAAALTGLAVLFSTIAVVVIVSWFIEFAKGMRDRLLPTLLRVHGVRAMPGL